MAKPPPTDLPIRTFSTPTDFESFLEREHLSTTGIYLKLAKKKSGIKSVSASEAVEIALCFGWIDGRANGFDEDWWLVRYTPRRPKSIWSQKNVKTVISLIENGKMRPAGLRAVESAKADGRWERAYAGPATMTVPEDFAKALKACSPAADFFHSLKKSDRYSLLMRIQTASPTSRDARIESSVQILAEGNWPAVPKLRSKKRSADELE